MDRSEPPILLFDVMSTLVYDPIAREIPAFFDLSLEELYAAKHPTAWCEFERGELSETEFYECYFPDRPDPIDGAALRRVLADAYTWIDGMESLLAELTDTEASIHAFSNYPIWYRIIEEQLALSRFLDWTIVSCHTGFRKPHERAYRNALSRLDAAAEQCLFIDDRASNCEAARAVGIDAVVFDDADQLRSELARRRLL